MCLCSVCTCLPSSQKNRNPNAHDILHYIHISGLFLCCYVIQLHDDDLSNIGIRVFMIDT